VVVLHRELDGKLRQNQAGAHLQQEIRSTLEIGVPIENLLQGLFAALELSGVGGFSGVQVELPLPEVLPENDGREQEDERNAARERSGARR